MLKTISQVEKEVWSDIIFTIVIHLLLLSLYAFVFFSSHLIFLRPQSLGPSLPTQFLVASAY